MSTITSHKHMYEQSRIQGNLCHYSIPLSSHASPTLIGRWFPGSRFSVCQTTCRFLHNVQRLTEDYRSNIRSTLWVRMRLHTNHRHTQLTIGNIIGTTINCSSKRSLRPRLPITNRHHGQHSTRTDCAATRECLSETCSRS